MTISRVLRCAITLCASAGILAGCNAAGTQTGYAPWIAGQSNGAARPNGTAHYYLVLLDTPAGSTSHANGINNNGWITGFANVSGKTTTHAALWRSGHRTDLGTLGGPDSFVGWPIKATTGQIVGGSDIPAHDPLDEKFCGAPQICLGFSWKNGVMTALQPLGGNNAQALGVNNDGQVVGVAETGVHDATCAAPQQLDYSGVVWQRNGTKIALPPIAGDTVSQAIAVNKAGWVVGASGPCGPVLNIAYGATHAVLWQTGSAIDLGNLGGTALNAATAINDHGQIAGASGLPGNTTLHAFLWQSGIMSDLGTLPGAVQSVAYGMNNQGQVVGNSCT
ncbi:MAG: hypothetical protein JOY69_01350, partial [Candidatus Eremiobacteraeota bacterium]|nr:hypothetical protein [Candidatus Eremiobacteraeota bacterium]